MANEQKVPSLTAALAAIGNAHVYKGNPFVADTWTTVGQKEGDVEGGPTQQWNQLQAPEITGDMVHNEKLMGENLVVTIPVVVLVDGTFYAANSPTGTSGGGYDFPQSPITTAVAVIPDDEVGGGLKYAAATWTRLAGNGIGSASGAGAAPKNALWIPRAVLSYGTSRWSIAAGGKQIIPVTIQAMFATAAGVPNGHKLYTWGDPVAAGWTGFLFSSSTP